MIPSLAVFVSLILPAYSQGQEKKYRFGCNVCYREPGCHHGSHACGHGFAEKRNHFFLQRRAGLRIRLSERAGLRLDWRDYMSRALRYGIPKNEPCQYEIVLPAGGVTHQFAGTIAFIVHL